MKTYTQYESNHSLESEKAMQVVVFSCVMKLKTTVYQLLMSK